MRKASSRSARSFSGSDCCPISAAAREAGGRARKSAALASGPAEPASPRIRICRPCCGHQNEAAACGLAARSRPFTLSVLDAKYQRPAASTSLQISTRDDTRPAPSAVASVIACGPGTSSRTAAPSQPRNNVTGSSGAARTSNSGSSAGNGARPRSISRIVWVVSVM